MLHRMVSGCATADHESCTARLIYPGFFFILQIRLRELFWKIGPRVQPVSGGAAVEQPSRYAGPGGSRESMVGDVPGVAEGSWLSSGTTARGVLILRQPAYQPDFTTSWPGIHGAAGPL